MYCWFPLSVLITDGARDLRRERLMGHTSGFQKTRPGNIKPPTRYNASVFILWGLVCSKSNLLFSLSPERKVTISYTLTYELWDAVTLTTHCFMWDNSDQTLRTTTNYIFLITLNNSISIIIRNSPSLRKSTYIIIIPDCDRSLKMVGVLFNMQSHSRRYKARLSNQHYSTRI